MSVILHHTTLNKLGCCKGKNVVSLCFDLELCLNCIYYVLKLLSWA